MTVLYLISKFLTFPAVLVRAFYEHILLRLFKVPVENASYLQLNEVFGHAEHDLISKKSANLCFCCIPGFLQVLFSVPLMAISFLQLYVLGVTPLDPQSGTVSPMFIICIVLRVFGIWLLSNVFPLYEDALNLREQVLKAKGFFKIFLFPVAVFVRIGAFLERFGITFWLLIIETVLLLWVF